VGSSLLCMTLRARALAPWRKAMLSGYEGTTADVQNQIAVVTATWQGSNYTSMSTAGA
jgi:hypothetical protein